MQIINFGKTYWVQIIFVCTLLGAMYKSKISPSINTIHPENIRMTSYNNEIV